jgi:hypothetical protein
VLFMGACIKPTIKIVTELCSSDLETLLQVSAPLLPSSSSPSTAP